MNEKLDKVQNEGKSSRNLYLEDVKLFEYDRKDKRMRRVERASACKEHLVSRIRE